MRVLFSILFLFAFAPAAFAAEKYICPMHPHISGTEGDVCPICGMTLVPKAEKTLDNAGYEGHSVDAIEGAFQIDPTYVQMLGVKTAEAKHYDFGRDIRAFGKTAPSTRLEYAIDMRAKGWIVNLPLDAVGDTVMKGDLLFTYYSPDLMTAQSDFLTGARVGNSEQRLRLFGMGEKAIAELRLRGRFFEETPFYAPADGVVTVLYVRKGSHVEEGASIMKLQDFSKLWVYADVAVKDVQFLAVETPATVAVPETGETFRTSIDLIYPTNNAQSRTVVVRLPLDNPAGTLKADSYVDVTFKADVQSRLAVPAEAVLYGSAGAYVLENLGDGYFKPVRVEPGITANGLTEIKSGLQKGQQIVTSGQFMLDSESNLRGGSAAMDHNHGIPATLPAKDMNTSQPEQESLGHGQH